MTKRITIDAPDSDVILAARHLDALAGSGWGLTTRLVGLASFTAALAVHRYTARHG